MHSRNFNNYMSITKDRTNTKAYVEFIKGELLLENYTEAYIAASELTRLDSRNGFLIDKIEALENEVALDINRISTYKKRAGFVLAKKTANPKNILVVTNLFPPQKLGGFGRTMFEFSQELHIRGHKIRVITADMVKFLRKSNLSLEEFEINVRRRLILFGDWVDGAILTEELIEKRIEISKYNASIVLEEVKDFSPDIVIAGNLDLLGNLLIKKLIDLNIPILHRLGNSNPGSNPAETPKSPIYWMAACSNWVNEDLRKKGYPFKKYLIVPPGSPLHIYYRYYPPNRDKLKIVYASLLLAYKGAHILLEALGHLKVLNIPFECNFAGDNLSQSYREDLNQISHANNLKDCVTFNGFLSMTDLSHLYSQCNTMVFPSIFDEPFGKSQIEGMAAGLLLISSDTKGSKELITDKKNGLFFKNNHVADLVKKLVWAHEHPKKASEIAKSGQDYSFRYTTSNCVDLLETSIHQLLAFKAKLND